MQIGSSHCIFNAKPNAPKICLRIQDLEYFNEKTIKFDAANQQIENFPKLGKLAKCVWP